jgi:hypothetical protein
MIQRKQSGERMFTGTAKATSTSQYLSTFSTFKIPKVKCSDSVRLCGLVKEFGEKYFTADGVILFCKLLCEVRVTAKKRLTVQQHRNTAK